MDDGNVTQADVSVSDEGLILSSSSSLGSCKFRGESYVCQGVSVNHPSHHTIEGVQADGEITALFRKPTGELMCMSSLFRINSAQTPSYNFFKQFVPYALPTGSTKLTLREWSISAMVPPEASYYVYNGSSLIPPCVPCEWVVFKSMINMDQGDFAYLVRNVEAGSRPVQAVGAREVFYNDINNIPGGPMPHDNKFYLRLRPTGNTKVGKLETKKVDLKQPLKQTKEEEEHPTDAWGKTKKWFADYYTAHGWSGFVIPVVVIYALVAGVGFAKTGPYKPEFAEKGGIWLRTQVDFILTYVVGFFWWILTYIKDTVLFFWNITVGWIFKVLETARVKGAAEESQAQAVSSSSASGIKPS